MSRWRFTVDVELDDQVLADLADVAGRPGTDPSTWDRDDLLAAVDIGLVELADVELSYVPLRLAEIAR